jgi:hypothetical protein
MNKNFIIAFLVFVCIINGNTFSQSVTAFAENNLSFGDVYMGYSKTVNHLDATAAKFRLVHNFAGNPNFIISFTLPGSLVFNSYNVPISFGAATSAYNTTDSPSGRTSFNPNSPLSAKILPNRSFYIWLGGVVNIPTNVIPGTYTGTITVTVVRQ